MRILVLAFTHAVVFSFGIGLGIYLLPILIAPAGPDFEAVRSVAASALFTGEFHRNLQDSDPLHWGEGMLYVRSDVIAFEGELAPGPDYRLYLSPAFVETESGFLAMRDEMVEVGPVRTFENFAVPVPSTIDPAAYRAAIVWCEAFGRFITAAAYQVIESGTQRN
ncbi:MAG: DM13 domain-containing protein [Pseudomonadales bacterium]